MTSIKTSREVPGSFRDPSGFLFWNDGSIYRQVNVTYRENYDYLMGSGLYQALVKHGLLISHEEVKINPPQPERAFKVIKPEIIPFISYPYEWCFSQFKDAALAAIKVQKMALRFGMSLKDCSAYNVQFNRGRPIFIDTLSLERSRQGQPWVGYRQFCQHFLAPLTLMAYKDIRLSQLLRVHLDGIPLDLASSLLPIRSRLNFPLLLHIHFHSRSQRHYGNKPLDIQRRQISRPGLSGILDSLESAVAGLKWQPRGTEWAEYYQETNYSTEALEHKKQAVAAFLDRVRPECVWDLGANVGVFSRIAGDKGIRTIAFDADPAALEKNYLDCVANAEDNVLPLLVDLTNPSPAIGWQSEERMSLLERGPADAALALALVHHLAIANNLPFVKIASFFSNICRWLIIEFVPKADSQVQRLLASREDIFTSYSQEAFEAEFGRYFTIVASVPIRDSKRVLYLMQRRD